MSARGARPRALLWDNDGLLVDTETLFLQASREILAGFGTVYKETPPAAFVLHARADKDSPV